MKKILIVEDDLGISSSLKLYLESSFYEVFLHHDGINALEKINKLNPDLVILDINLPEKSGNEIIVELRKTSSIPVIMLTARGGELDKINGLELGADDYIAKPFSPRELLARINTILRRFSDVKPNSSDDSIINFLDIEIDTIKKSVKKGSKKITFTSNEYEILKSLVLEDGGIISRESIMKDIIGYDNYLYDRTVDTHIKNIRKKLGEKDIIITVRGEGYRLNK